MKKILAIIIFLLFLLLLWCTKETYTTCCQSKNNDTVITQEKTDEKVVKEEPLMYQWNSDQGITNDKWPALKESVLGKRSDGKVLQITAPYFEEEGEEVGLKRAENALGKLNSDTLLIKNAEFKSKLLSFYEGAKTANFGGTKFNWFVRNDNIKEVDGKTLIYFPTNSTKKLENAQIIAYINDIAESLKDNDKKVMLSGHSDNQGDADKNKTLALARAETIKSELVGLGVDASRISVVSYGEERPIADNGTAEGRQANRRVELEIK